MAGSLSAERRHTHEVVLTMNRGNKLFTSGRRKVRLWHNESPENESQVVFALRRDHLGLRDESVVIGIVSCDPLS